MGATAAKLRDFVRPPPSQQLGFDLFVAAPMAAHITRSAFDENQAAVMAAIEELVSQGAARNVYYAGSAIGPAKAFKPSKDALDEDLSALAASSRFVFVYPAKLATGALVELGYAMALRRPVAILARDYDDLPYFLRHIRDRRQSKVAGPIVVRLYASDDDLARCARDALDELERF
ncbi:MAG: hypothetical protein NVSMB18_07860 [Acetobacteraceae bacterium]